MPIIRKTISYSTLTGQKYDADTLLKDLYSKDRYFKRKSFIMDFGKGRKIAAKIQFPRKINAIVENPSSRILGKCIRKYMKNRRVSVTHKSDSHSLHINRKGELSLDYLLNGSRLSSTDNVYVGTFKSVKKLNKKTEEWSKISSNLDLKTSPPKTLAMNGDCKAVKLCTQFKSLSAEEVPSYITETLLKNMNKPPSKLHISAEDSSLTLDAGDLNMNVDYSPEFKRNESALKFALGMIENIRSEPVIHYNVKVKSNWEAVKKKISGFYWRYSDEIKMGGGFAALPTVFGTLFGMSAIQNGRNALVESGVGVATGFLIDSTLLSVVFGSIAYGEWKSERADRKEKAYKQFRDFAEQQEHHGADKGTCVVLSTDKCVLNAAKKKSKTSAATTVLSYFGRSKQ